MELRQCEIEQANIHVKYLSTYMSDSFMARGGDHEAILVLLLIPRMTWKVNILSNQIKDKFSTVTEITKANVLKGHEVERFTFGCHMMLKLSCLEAILNQFEAALRTCSPETFLRMGTLFPEMSVHER
jgi:dynactin 1